MLIKTTLFTLASVFTLPAFAHVSQSSAQMHQAEHLLWALALVPAVWFGRAILVRIKH